MDDSGRNGRLLQLLGCQPVVRLAEPEWVSIAEWQQRWQHELHGDGHGPRGDQPGRELVVLYLRTSRVLGDDLHQRDVCVRHSVVEQRRLHQRRQQRAGLQRFGHCVLLQRRHHHRWSNLRGRSSIPAATGPCSGSGSGANTCSDTGPGASAYADSCPWARSWAVSGASTCQLQRVRARRVLGGGLLCIGSDQPSAWRNHIGE